MDLLGFGVAALLGIGLGVWINRRMKPRSAWLRLPLAWIAGLAIWLGVFGAFLPTSVNSAKQAASSNSSASTSPHSNKSTSTSTSTSKPVKSILVADEKSTPTIGPHALDTYHPVTHFTPDIQRARAYCDTQWDAKRERKSYDHCVGKQKAGQAYLTLYMRQHGLMNVIQLQRLYRQGNKWAYAYGQCIHTFNPDHSQIPDMNMIGWCVLRRTNEHLGDY